MRSRRTDAGSSSGSWGTRSPRKALARIDWSRKSKSSSEDVNKVSTLDRAVKKEFILLTISFCSFSGAMGIGKAETLEILKV